jgi:hypothetical protein
VPRWPWSRDAVGLPHYSRLETTVHRDLPSELMEEERSEAFLARSALLQDELREPLRRPPDDAPLFTELLADKGPLTIPLPEGGACLPVFSTPFRAFDYARTYFAKGPRVTYLSSSPRELVVMLRELRRAGVESFTVDRCPRCTVLLLIGSAQVEAAGDAITMWSIPAGGRLASADLYFRHARGLALSGQLEGARELALQTVGHVTMEDPRPHLLLGQLALQLGDRGLLKEARAFLRYFRFGAWEQKLDQAERSGAADFGVPA